MRVRDHIILGGVLSAGLYPVLGVKCLAFWTASVLIDGDHYLEFLYHNGLRSFSLKGAIAFHRVLYNWLYKVEFINLSVFHTLEFLLAVYLLSFWMGSPWLRVAFYGMILHFVLDAAHLYRCGMAFKRAFSVTEFLVRKAIMRRNGLYPGVLYKKALEEVSASSQ